jgi:serine/threonine protein phosphatase PrpC
MIARLVASVDGKAVRVTVDHKASDADEQARVKAAGGFITNDRVNGQIEVTRSIGDQLMKKYIISTPHTSTTKLTDAHTHLIVGCDGVSNARKRCVVICVCV